MSDKDDVVLKALELLLPTKCQADYKQSPAYATVPCGRCGYCLGNRAIAIQKAQARVIKSAQDYVDDYIHDEITRIPLRDALAALDEVKK